MTICNYFDYYANMLSKGQKVMEIGSCLKSDPPEETHELQAACTTCECLLAVRGCQDISLSHDMHCIRINPFCNENIIFDKWCYFRKTSGRHMPQNKVIEHFHQYEYDLSPTNYFFKPKYHLIY